MKAQCFYIFSVLVWYTLAVPIKEQSKKFKLKAKFIPKYKPTTCSGLGICNDTITYPVNIIHKLVKKKKYLPLFSKVSLIEPADDMPMPMFRDAEPNNLCKTRTVTIFPKAAFDLNSYELRFIVNIQDFEQSLVYETCVEENKECFDKLEEILPFNFRTMCKQKFNVVRLVSLTRNGKLEYGKFLVPSTCVCSYLNPMNNSLR